MLQEGEQLMFSKRKCRLFINSCKIFAGLPALFLLLAVSSCTAPADGRPIQQGKEMVVHRMPYGRSIDPFMGDWEGSGEADDGEKFDFVAQAIALGDGKYRVLTLEEFDTRKKPMHVLDGVLEGDKFVYTADDGLYDGEGTLSGEKFRAHYKGQVNGRFEMHRIERLSPTLGQKPPKGAVVLFDGSNFDQWRHPKKSGPVKWKLVNGAMEVEPGAGSIITRKEFTDIELHLEFRTPFMPKARGQKRGNSGVYLMGRYEVQILDSYGLEGADNECGGVYKVAVPRVNMCAVPMQWQSYDITFHSARFDSAGAKIKNARLTVLHNGVKIHDNIELPRPTTASLGKNESGTGPVFLQAHGNRVQYRNIWLLELP